MNQSSIRNIISIGAILLIIVRLAFPKITVDNTVLILLVVAILPWLSSVFKSIEFPSGHKIELQDFKAAVDKISTPIKETAAKETVSVPELIIDSKPSFLSIIDRDPNLAVVGLRIEIEKRLKVLASLYNINEQTNISALTRQLREQGVLDSNTTNGLLDLIKLGNQAAHGAQVESNVTEWIFSSGKQVIRNLDLLTAKNYDPNIEEALKTADTVLAFEGEKVIEMSISLLNMAKQMGHIMLKPEDTLKMKTGDILARLGALRAIDEYSSGAWTKHIITPLGNALYTHLISK